MENLEDLEFVAFYMPLGDIQLTSGKGLDNGVIIKNAEPTKMKNGLCFYNIDGEIGERKFKLDNLNKFRDFGTSIYGVFNKNFCTRNEYIQLIIEKLEERVLETYKAKSVLLLELEKGE